MYVYIYIYLYIYIYIYIYTYIYTWGGEGRGAVGSGRAPRSVHKMSTSGSQTPYPNTYTYALNYSTTNIISGNVCMQ